MSTPTHFPDTHVSDGADLVARELREELWQLVTHPIRELKRLEHVAADGESPTTPLLTALAAAIFVGVLFALVLGLTLLVVSLAT